MYLYLYKLTCLITCSEVINAMNFTKEQIQPYRNINLFKLKESLEKKKDVDEEAPAAKIPRLDGDDAKLELGTLDGLIIACRRPNAIAKELLKLLAPSQNFAIFCPYIEVKVFLKIMFIL